MQDYINNDSYENDFDENQNMNEIETDENSSVSYKKYI